MLTESEIQELFSEYAFKDIGPCGTEAQANAEAGAITNGPFKEPIEQSQQWLEDRAVIYDLIKRSYEEPIKWYLVVAKPFDRTYKKDPHWYEVKGLDALRKKLGKSCAYVGTREICATKVHVNFVVASPQLKVEDGTNTHKYKLSVQQLKSPCDRLRALDYICKESLSRPFKRYLDYLFSNPNKA